MKLKVSNMKKEFTLLHILIYSFSITVLLSFQLPESIDQKKLPFIVKEKLDEEVKHFYEERMKICKLDALTRAEDFVDSIIENKIHLVIAKGIIFPNKPIKPSFPREIRINDSTKIQPVLKSDELNK